MNRRFVARLAICIGVLTPILCFYGWRVCVRVSAQSFPNQASTPSGSQFDPNPLDDPQIRERQIRALNEQRQKKLVEDTEKLLLLTNQLHQELTAQSFSGPTPAQVEKLDRIEKLAKNVREKMIETYGDSGSLFRDPFMRPFP